MVKKVKIRNRDELLLSEYIEIAKLSIPEKLKKIVVGEDAKPGETIDNLTNKEKTDFFNYYGNLIEIIYKIDCSDVIYEQRESIFFNILFDFIVPVYLGLDYELIEKPGYIDFQNQRYFLPELKKINDNVIPFWNETALAACDLLDLQMNAKQYESGYFDVLPNIISILARKKDEKYDRFKSLKRAEKFKNLKMKQVWQFFFMLDNFRIIYMKNSTIQSLKKQLKKIQKAV